MVGFQKAVRSRRRLKAAIDGPSGAGKTYSTLRLAFSLVEAGLGSRVAVVDTENDSASLYAGEAPDGRPWEFDTLNLKEFGPDRFVSALEVAFKGGYDVVVVDSLSHAWVGDGGALDLVDKKGGNKFAAWKDVTPLHRRMVDAIVRAPAHVLVTMRSKTEYVLEDDERGKKVPRKIGVAPVQREGMEYEFDVYASTDWSHQLKVTKSRCPVMQDMTGVKVGPAFWRPLFDWLASAAPSPVAQPDPEPVKGPPADGPGASPEAVRDDFLAGIRQAATAADLSRVGAEIKAAVDRGRVGPHRGELTAAYKARLAEVAPAANGKPVEAPAA